jgi:hypothetical protein
MSSVILQKCAIVLSRCTRVKHILSKQSTLFFFFFTGRHLSFFRRFKGNQFFLWILLFAYNKPSIFLSIQTPINKMQQIIVTLNTRESFFSDFLHKQIDNVKFLSIFTSNSITHSSFTQSWLFHHQYLANNLLSLFVITICLKVAIWSTFFLIFLGSLFGNFFF